MIVTEIGPPMATSLSDTLAPVSLNLKTRKPVEMSGERQAAPVGTSAVAHLLLDAYAYRITVVARAAPNLGFGDDSADMDEETAAQAQDRSALLTIAVSCHRMLTIFRQQPRTGG